MGARESDGRQAQGGMQRPDLGETMGCSMDFGVYSKKLLKRFWSYILKRLFWLPHREKIREGQE